VAAGAAWGMAAEESRPAGSVAPLVTHGKGWSAGGGALLVGGQRGATGGGGGGAIEGTTGTLGVNGVAVRAAHLPPEFDSHHAQQSAQYRDLEPSMARSDA